ncbi:MFS transporter [Brachyspira innocens]|uniref:MFS transporter n=1 Tax=Brachyspira innocens TaxID=13264 RepID=UPI000379E07C|nr:MFS transporter [Brachyspira innocens]
MKLKDNHKLTLYSCYIGYITQAIINIFPPLVFIMFQKNFNISLTQIGILSSFNFAVQMIVDFLSIKFIDKIGYRVPIVAAHIFSALGLFLLGVLPFYIEPYLAMLICFFINAISGGLIEVLVSPIVEALPEKQKTKAMNILHSFYSWGSMIVVILSTLYFNIFRIDNWRYMSMLWALVPFINIFLFANVPLNVLKTHEDNMNANNVVSIRKLLSVKIVLVFSVLMICAGASEQSIAQWVSLFAEAGLNVDKTIGDIFGACMFAFCMGIVRLIYGMNSEKIDIKKALLISSFLCIIGYLITVFSPYAFLSLIGCAVSGLSVAMMWPSVFSLSSKIYSKGGTAMFALLALAGDAGCSLGPFIVGIVSNDIYNNFNNAIVESSLKVGILFAVFFPILMFIVLLFFKNNKTNS